MFIINLILLGLCYARCPVYCFFELFTVDKDFHKFRQDTLLRSWFRNWWAYGWNPKVLRLEDAVGYPEFENNMLQFSKLPTVNGKSYELACYARWMAFWMQGGGGFVDYDMMNFPVENMPLIAGECGREPIDPGSLISFKTLFPMLLFSDRLGVENLLKAFYNFPHSNVTKVNGKPHISDMLIARQSSELDKRILNLPNAIWHFANGALSKIQKEQPKVAANVSRSDWIRRTLSFNHAYRKKTNIWSIDGFSIDERLRDLMGPLLNCPAKEDHVVVLWDARLKPGEAKVCGGRIVSNVEAKPDDNEYTILFLEPVLDRVKRNKDNRLEDHIRNPINQNVLLRKLVPECIGDMEDIQSLIDCLEYAKAKLGTTERLVLGFIDRIAESKMVLEYSVGFFLPVVHHSAYIPLPITEYDEEIIRLNWADIRLYEYAYALWSERLEEVQVVESQLERYNHPPLIDLNKY